jgi:hypothetical protein
VGAWRPSHARPVLRSQDAAAAAPRRLIYLWALNVMGAERPLNSDAEIRRSAPIMTCFSEEQHAASALASARRAGTVGAYPLRRIKGAGMLLHLAALRVQRISSPACARQPLSTWRRLKPAAPDSRGAGPGRSRSRRPAPVPSCGGLPASRTLGRSRGTPAAHRPPPSDPPWPQAEGATLTPSTVWRPLLHCPNARHLPQLAPHGAMRPEVPC